MKWTCVPQGGGTPQYTRLQQRIHSESGHPTLSENCRTGVKVEWLNYWDRSRDRMTKIPKMLIFTVKIAKFRHLNYWDRSRGRMTKIPKMSIFTVKIAKFRHFWESVTDGRPARRCVVTPLQLQIGTLKRGCLKKMPVFCISSHDFSFFTFQACPLIRTL